MKIGIFQNLFSSVHRLFKILNPMPEIGGIEISDSTIKFIFIKRDKSVFISLNLPIGTMSGGKVLDKNKLKESLKELHTRITPKLKKKIYVVTNISDDNIYAQSFNLPAVALSNLEEAAKLNLQMISPMDFSTAYSDWQKIGETKNDGGQLEVLGAFITKGIVDDITECLRDANFVVVAVEYAGLAISRVVTAALPQNLDFILMYLGANGLNFIFIKNSNFCFNHFTSWPNGEERQIKMSVIEEMVVSEMKKTLNFVASHWPEIQIKNIFFATPVLDEKLTEIISKNFGIQAQKVVLPATLKDVASQWSADDKQMISLSSDWFSVLGSALRGLIPRSKDIIISLASAGTEEEFRQHRIINFIKMWRNAVLASVVLILLSFISVDLFIASITRNVDVQLLNLSNMSISQDITNLQFLAKDFNAKVDLALKAKDSIYNFSPIIERIVELARNENILIERIFTQSRSSDILLNGRASDYQNIIDFKEGIEKDSLFKDVDLPLSGVTISSDGVSSFKITFKIK